MGSKEIRLFEGKTIKFDEYQQRGGALHFLFYRQVKRK